MEQKEIVTVIFKKRAANSIAKLAFYITEKGYPETSQKYRKRLYQFGHSLALFPDKYPVCKHKVYAKRKYRCVAFEKTYVFVYKLVKNKLIIYNVIHGKRLG